MGKELEEGLSLLGGGQPVEQRREGRWPREQRPGCLREGVESKEQVTAGGRDWEGAIFR